MVSVLSVEAIESISMMRSIGWSVNSMQVTCLTYLIHTCIYIPSTMVCEVGSTKTGTDAPPEGGGGELMARNQMCQRWPGSVSNQVRECITNRTRTWQPPVD